VNNSIASPDIARAWPIFSRQLICLMAATFIAYANISVFFGFVDHLRTLSVAPNDYGVLIGALAAASLIVRPLISPFFHSANARPLLLLGTGLASASLAAYMLATGFWTMLLVRIFHGIAFTVLGTALMALIVDVIPKRKSAQFFGYLAVVTLLPYTLIPPLLPFLDTRLGGFNQILLLFAAVTLLIVPLVNTATGKQGDAVAGPGSTSLSGREVIEGLKDLRVLRILTAMLLLYCGHAMIFFFLDGYGGTIGIAYAGLFLTLSTVGEIGIRVGAGSLFDRMNKHRLAAWTLAGLCLAYLVLAHAPGKGVFFGLGLIFGLGWGVAMPVFNGLLFDVSASRFRTFNINLGLQMFQAGFFLGPMIGAPLLAGWGYGTIYHLCGGMSLLAAALVFTKGVSR
jgi:predicted MFS family arabinose efflux permease